MGLTWTTFGRRSRNPQVRFLSAYVKPEMDPKLVLFLEGEIAPTETRSLPKPTRGFPTNPKWVWKIM